MTRSSGVLFVLSTLDVGGSERKIVRIANVLARSGTNAEIAYLNPPETLLGMIDTAVPTTHLHRRGKFSLRSLRRLRVLIGQRDPVVVAVNLYPLLYSILAVKFWRSKQGKVVGLVNTVSLRGRDRLVYAPFLRRCDRIVFGCAAQQKEWAQMLRLPPRSSTYIYNGVDQEWFASASVPDSAIQLRLETGIPSGAFVIGSVGRLAPEKSFDMLIRALAQLRSRGRDAFLVLAGQGPDRANLEELTARYRIADRVKFLGLLDDVRPALAIMDVFVLPSSDVETFSNAALEAMSMGRPVVLSNLGGAAEMIVDGESGLLFEVGDMEALVDILMGLVDSSEFRTRLGAAARQRVLDRLQFDDMVDRYRELLKV